MEDNTRIKTTEEMSLKLFKETDKKKDIEVYRELAMQLARYQREVDIDNACSFLINHLSEAIRDEECKQYLYDVVVGIRKYMRGKVDSELTELDSTDVLKDSLMYATKKYNEVRSSKYTSYDQIKDEWNEPYFTCNDLSDAYEAGFINANNNKQIDK